MSRTHRTSISGIRRSLPLNNVAIRLSSTRTCDLTSNTTAMFPTCRHYNPLARRRAARTSRRSDMPSIQNYFSMRAHFVGRHQRAPARFLPVRRLSAPSVAHSARTVFYSLTPSSYLSLYAYAPTSCAGCRGHDGWTPPLPPFSRRAGPRTYSLVPWQQRTVSCRGHATQRNRGINMGRGRANTRNTSLGAD